MVAQDATFSDIPARVTSDLIIFVRLKFESGMLVTICFIHV